VGQVKVCFWQNMPSHHQAPALRVFSQLWPDQVYGIWCSGALADRSSLGWQRPNFDRLEEIVLPAAGAEQAACKLMGDFADAIHVLGGFHAYAPIISAYREAVRRGIVNLAIMAEPGVAMGWKGRLRPWQAHWLARRYVPHIKAVLAMGQHGVEFYRHAGFPFGVLYPFMYQCEAFAGVVSSEMHDPVRLVYAGRFIPRKGVDVMIRALSQCRQQNWHLQIIGEGPGKAEMQTLAEASGIGRQIEWLGAQPSNRILDLLSQNDVCLIPSRFEGWGVVCNEALQSGLAVICSDKVTSREIVQASQAGKIFRSGDANELAGCIQSLLENPESIGKMRQNAIAYRSRIAPEVVGHYLKDVLAYAFLGEGEKIPFPPWLNPASPLIA
jgi:glycosyltransferase involved in cell wall biosynthesis